MANDECGYTRPAFSITNRRCFSFSFASLWNGGRRTFTGGFFLDIGGRHWWRNSDTINPFEGDNYELGIFWFPLNRERTISNLSSDFVGGGEKRNAIKRADVGIQISLLKKFAQSVSKGKIRSEINFTFQTWTHTYIAYSYSRITYFHIIYI